MKKTAEEIISSLGEQIDGLKNIIANDNREQLDIIIEELGRKAADEKTRYLDVAKKRYNSIAGKLEREMNSLKKEGASPQTDCKRIAFLDKEIEDTKSILFETEAENDRLKKRIKALKEDKKDFLINSPEVKQLRESVNAFSAERSKWLKKLKRAGVKT